MTKKLHGIDFWFVKWEHCTTAEHTSGALSIRCKKYDGWAQWESTFSSFNVRASGHGKSADEAVGDAIKNGVKALRVREQKIAKMLAKLTGGAK